jgi:hypothetical protein
VYFSCFKTISSFSGIVSALKINSKKKENLSYRIGPSPKAQLASAGPASRPAEAHLGSTGSQGLPGQAAAASIADLGKRARPGGRTSAPI